MRNQAAGTPNPIYTFQNFNCTDDNAAAFGFATVVSLSYESNRSPLLLIGVRGSGKTHLMHAIANQWLHFEPSGKLRFLAASAFLGPEQVDKDLALVDLLFVEGLEALLSQDVAQDHLRTLGEALRLRDRQIVLSIESATNDLKGLNQGMIDYLNSGTAVMLSKISR